MSIFKSIIYQEAWISLRVPRETKEVSNITHDIVNFQGNDHILILENRKWCACQRPLGK